MWGTSSTTLHDDGDILQRPWVLVDQLLHSASVRYLPDRSRACTVAIAVLVGEDAAVVHSGWVEARDMNCGRKNSNVKI